MVQKNNLTASLIFIHTLVLSFLSLWADWLTVDYNGISLGENLLFESTYKSPADLKIMRVTSILTFLFIFGAVCTVLRPQYKKWSSTMSGIAVIMALVTIYKFHSEMKDYIGVTNITPTEGVPTSNTTMMVKYGPGFKLMIATAIFAFLSVVATMK
jgi:O-antigen ligase